MERDRAFSHSEEKRNTWIILILVTAPNIDQRKEHYVLIPITKVFAISIMPSLLKGN